MANGTTAVINERGAIMEIKFKMSRQHTLAVMQALDTYSLFLELDWQKAFQVLSDFAYCEKYEGTKAFRTNWKKDVQHFQNLLFNKDELNISKILDFNEIQKITDIRAKFADKYPSEKYKIELSVDDVGNLESVLDFVVRIAIGQWNNLALVLCGLKDENNNPVYDKWSCDEPFVCHYRNRIFRVFEDECLSSSLSSIGIYSSLLSDQIHRIYEVYKELMYEYKCFGTYSCRPMKATADKTPLPEIQFPLTFIFEFDGDLEKAKKILKSPDKPSVIHRDCREYSDVPGQLFIPIQEDAGTVYQRLIPGDKVYRKLNGFYVVKKPDNTSQEPKISKNNQKKPHKNLKM